MPLLAKWVNSCVFCQMSLSLSCFLMCMSQALHCSCSSGALNTSVLFSGSSRGNKDQCMFLLYIDATSVSNTKGNIFWFMLDFCWEFWEESMSLIYFILFFKASSPRLEVKGQVGHLKIAQEGRSSVWRSFMPFRRSSHNRTCFDLLYSKFMSSCITNTYPVLCILFKITAVSPNIVGEGKNNDPQCKIRDVTPEIDP